MPPKKAQDKEESTATVTVFDYLVKQNRPYNAGDIFTNLHEQVGKTLLAHVLTNLVTENKIKEKPYGKQKIYYADQGQFEKVDKAEMDRMDAEIERLKGELESVQKTAQELEAELRGLESEPGTADARAQLETLKQENEHLKSKLEKLQNAEDRVSEADKDRIMKQYDGNVKEWKRRKRMAGDILDAILENYPKSKKILFDEIGIVTDDDAKVDSKTF